MTLLLDTGNIKDIETRCAIGIEQCPTGWPAANGANA